MSRITSAPPAWRTGPSQSPAVLSMQRSAPRARAAAALAAPRAVPITREGPQRLPPETGNVTAFKFRDPDGHPLELLHFPAGTGSVAWQAPNPASPFLGIDHTALSVADVPASVAFLAGQFP